MKSEFKDEIKSLVIKSGKSLSEIAEELEKKYRSKYSLQNLSNKLQRGTLKYKEALDIAEIIGYEIIWNKKKTP